MPAFIAVGDRSTRWIYDAAMKYAISLLMLTLVSASPATQSATPTSATSTTTSTDPDAKAWQELDGLLGAKGVTLDGVHTYRFVRNDLDVSVEGMPIPSAAGIETVFHFYRCTCGHMNVVGQFVVTQAASSDVQGVLSGGEHLRVVSIGPLLLGEVPRLLVIRFQGEGTLGEMATTLQAARTESTRKRAAQTPWR